jgi:cellulose synthase/poly-beta-1,6-N-acetylglucosamine synthase-like glycosyltransferase
MMLLALAILAFVLAVVPALLFARNWKLYAPAPTQEPPGDLTSVSVLIPARNEQPELALPLKPPWPAAASRWR